MKAENASSIGTSTRWPGPPLRSRAKRAARAPQAAVMPVDLSATRPRTNRGAAPSPWIDMKPESAWITMS
jgi:hypothetical protein